MYYPKCGTRKRCLLLSCLFNTVLEVLVSAIRQGGLEKKKQSCLTHKQTCMEKNPKKSTKKLLELMNSSCKIQSQTQTMVFLHTNRRLQIKSS